VYVKPITLLYCTVGRSVSRIPTVLAGVAVPVFQASTAVRRSLTVVFARASVHARTRIAKRYSW